MTLGSTVYVRNSLQAVAVYCDALGLTLGYSQKHDDGTYLHAELEKDGKTIFAVSESGDEGIAAAMLKARQPTISLGVDLANNEELTRAFHLLSEGGHVLRPLGELPWSPLSADLVDRFGVCWYLFVSLHRPEE
jgi:uncharacterized glyoxalase superfamily protein PhnB